MITLEKITQQKKQITSDIQDHYSRSIDLYKVMFSLILTIFLNKHVIFCLISRL